MAVLAALFSFVAFVGTDFLYAAGLIPLETTPHRHVKQGLPDDLFEILFVYLFICVLAVCSWRILYMRIRDYWRSIAEVREYEESQRQAALREGGFWPPPPRGQT